VVDEHGRPVPDGEFGYLVGTSLHHEAIPREASESSDG
jgi:phenylacetate-coenzyme A ligase PaaK-like adenylate-forming protein